MPRKASLVVAATAVSVLSLGSAGSAAANGNDAPTLTLSDSPAGPQIQEFEIAIVGPDTSGDVQGYLRASLAVTATRLFVEPITDATSSAGLGGADVTFTANGLAQEDAGFPLPAGEKNVVIRVTATGIDRDGTFKTRILTTIDGDVKELAGLTIKRTPAPLLGILGAKDGVDGRESDTPMFKQSFVIRSTSNINVTGATMTLAIFDPTGNQLEPMVDIGAGPVRAVDVAVGDIVAFGSKTGTVTLELPTTGTYTGEITLAYDKRAETTKLTITRTHVDPTVAAGTIAIGTGEAIWPFSASPVLRATLHETGGHTVDLQRPTAELARLDGEEHKQASLRSVEVVNADGATDWTFAPDQERRIEIKIVDLVGAGTFSGTLKLTRLGSGTVEVPFTVRQRASVLWAAGFIGVGVLLSFIARNRLGASLRRTRAQRNVVLVQKRLYDVSEDLDLNPVERQVVEFLSKSLDDLVDMIRADRVLAADITTALEDLAARVDLMRPWVQNRIRVEAVRPPDLRAGLRRDLEAVGAQLMAADGLAGARADLTAWPAKVESAAKDRVVALAAETKRDVVRMAPLIGDPAVQEFNARLDAITAADPSPADVLFDRLDLIRSEYVGRLITTFSNHLRRPEGPPEWFADPGWSDLRQRTILGLEAASAAPDTAVRTERFQSTNLAYVGALAAELGTWAAGKANANPQGRAPFDAVTAKTATALLAVERADPAGAREALDEAIAEYKKAVGGGRLGPGGIRPSVALAPSSVLKDVRVVSTVEAAKVPNPRRRLLVLDSDIRKREELVAIITLIAAIAVGLNALYVGNQTWGSLADVFIAVLWGLGLHQVAGAALDLDTIKNSMLGEPSTTDQ